MRKLYVPISVSSGPYAEEYLKDFEKLGVERIFFAEASRLPLEDGERRANYLAMTKEQLEFYAAKGYKVGAWVSTIGYGAPLGWGVPVDVKSFTKLRSVVGREVDDAFCPLDEKFTARVERMIEDLCRAGVRLIMLDDDLCLYPRPGLGCACERHLAEFSRRVGEKVTLEGLPQKLFVGKSNHYRRVWIDLMGDTLRDLCRRVRAAADRVDPTVRIGFSSGYTSWDLEGADAIELTHILAGNTKPFLRLTAAPYWYASQRFGRTTLQSIIEFARMQFAWCEGEGIELFTECDTYPHDRYHTPRAYIESFDVGTMLTKDLGSLKYFYHYPCSPAFERGYIDAHFASLADYEALQQAFYSRPEVGVRVYEEMHKIKEATLPATFNPVKSHKQIMRKFAFSEAQALLTSNAIPTVYQGEGLCGIAFGENAKYLPEGATQNGLILDITAAKILQEKGIDVGLRSSAPRSDGALEQFVGGACPVSVADSAGLCDITVAQDAVVDSYFTPADALSKTAPAPASYRYENAKGQRFFVYAFRAEVQNEFSGVYWCYGRDKQLANAVAWLSGKELPAVCTGNPHLYCRCNESEDSVAVAYFNCTADGVEKTTVSFARPIASANVIGGKGRLLDEHTVLLEDVRAYGYVAIEAQYR